MAKQCLLHCSDDGSSSDLTDFTDMKWTTSIKSSKKWINLDTDEKLLAQKLLAFECKPACAQFHAKCYNKFNSKWRIEQAQKVNKREKTRVKRKTVSGTVPQKKKTEKRPKGDAGTSNENGVSDDGPKPKSMKRTKKSSGNRASKQPDQSSSDLGFQFHDECGQSIELTNNKRTAYRFSEFGHGIVISSSPMEKNILYEVQVDEIDEKCHSGNHYVGVWSQTAEDIYCPPYASIIDYKAPAMLSPRAVWINGVETKNCVDVTALGQVTVGSRIGVLVDSDYYVHVMVNGEDLGRITPQPPLSPQSQPTYAVFDLGFRVRKVTTQPLTHRT